MFVNGCDVRSLVKKFFFRKVSTLRKERPSNHGKRKEKKKKRRKIEIKFISFFSVFVIDLGFSC